MRKRTGKRLRVTILPGVLAFLAAIGWAIWQQGGKLWYIGVVIHSSLPGWAKGILLGWW